MEASSRKTEMVSTAKEDEEPPFTKEVICEERDSTGRKNVVKTELQ